MKKFLLMVVLSVCSIYAYAQNTVSGKVVDAESGEALIGATVLEKGTRNGVTTDIEGDFKLKVDNGAMLEISYVGYERIEIPASSDLSSIKMKPSYVGLNEIQVLASVAMDRKTPVAFSTVERKTILERASNQEFPELLKSTPGVYATKQGGGYGDSRINLRGFNSENVAVLINGVPVNDMENGRVYWSNWAGLTDVTTSMQVQRGLGASKVAVPSIGGTINILTQNTDAEKGGNIYYGLGNNNFQKSSFYVSTGLTDNDWAISLSGAKITGDGFVDGTSFEGYNYFFNVSKIINDQHSLSLTGFGAPQRHGQRQSRKTIETYQKNDRGIKLNTDYGYLDGQLVNVEDNFYHKPQISLNHYWSLNETTDISTALYVSTGTGGGGGVGGTLLQPDVNGNGLEDDLYDLEATRQANYENNDYANGGDGNATGFLRASRNDHRWYGMLSTIDTDINSSLSFQGGLDLRSYRGIHFTEVTDLLGANYVLDNSDINNPNKRAKVGDKISYYNDGVVLWEGLFGQAEYTQDKWTAFLSASVSNTSYKRVDYFQYEPENQESEFLHFLGYQVKGGANYRLTDNHNVFVNAGNFTKAPEFGTAFLDFTNETNEDAVMQKITSVELGYGYRSANFNANVNLYHTRWNDRTLVESFQVGDTLYIANLTGVNAIHQGVEIDWVYKPITGLRINGMVSLGDWTWANDISDVQIFNELQQPVGDPINLYISGLKVGNSAQTTASLGASYQFQNLKIGALANYYTDNYADYDPNDRTTEANIGVQPWQIPDYFNLDINANYSFKIGNQETIIYGNVNNVLDADYITDAIDGSIETVEVYPGTGRQWTIGLRLKF
ncbi:TonB-dependent receptor [Marivirga atlantica]|uniref:Carboxypeptidase-like regulatory domain-containing protein n=1 Tax=Marivirga atlantica TaxID=1548457 RepID=A0A937DLA2_9BACT|nr:TonB-dependent receptor [Marivirga atlantica]MBL0766879.1 carboxypeptidase-like regulatory domain-containing protein [Marivirga atlantica]